MNHLSEVEYLLKINYAKDFFKIINHTNYILVILKSDERNWILVDLVDHKTTMKIYEKVSSYQNFSLAFYDMIILLFGAISEEENINPNNSIYSFIPWSNNWLQ